MAEITYIFGDALTGDIIEEIRLTSVSLKMSLDGGEFRATFHLDQTGKDNDTLISATEPGRTLCTVERDGQVIGDYLVWTRTYQSQAKVAEIYGIPLKAYTESRFATVDYSATDIEQRNIMRDLYILMQSDDNSIRVDLPDVFPTVTPKSLDVYSDEYKTYRQLMDSIADTVDGFDWLVRTVRESGGYRRFLDIGFPTIGSLESPYMPIFEYVHTEDSSGGNVTNYWANDSMGSRATNFYGIGNGEGSSMLISPFVHTDLLASGFPRFDTTYDRKDIDDQTLLDSLTAQHAELYKATVGTLTVEVKADAEPTFGSYNVGDTCKVVIKDVRYPNGLQKVTRILAMEYYPPEDSNVEMVRLTFEGDQG